MLEESTKRKPLHAVRIVIRGIVQGVGFRPFVYKLAKQHNLRGWVLNDEEGVKIHAEGDKESVELFIRNLPGTAPAASRIDSMDVHDDEQEDAQQFSIIESRRGANITTRISPDLCICKDCLRDLNDPNDRHYRYPYVNCTNCGPRFSIVLGLPYDRDQTCMAPWQMCSACKSEYENPEDRRFHAQPVACPACGPTFKLVRVGLGNNSATGDDAIRMTCDLLHAGKIIGIKGIGGYHLACDATNSDAINTLRERKYRKDKPFAVIIADLDLARSVVDLDEPLEKLLTSIARPIVLAPSRIDHKAISPDNNDMGIMLPYSPLHHLLFAFGAPKLLVLTSANRSSEPIAYKDEDAFQHLSEIADAFLVGERPIARRIDDSVAGESAFGTSIFRRARGYAPDAVCAMPAKQPILAVGADLKNSVTLLVNGQAFVSQHIGDLEHLSNMEALAEIVRDFVSMYEITLESLIVAHDAHPEYRSTQYAFSLPGSKHIAIQHHQAHVASVLAEDANFDKRVLGIALDGTGYGADGTIWGGEFFIGSVSAGFQRVGHLRYAHLPGGDAAATFPPQAAAGFLYGLPTPDLSAAPFRFGARFVQAQQLIARNIQTWKTSSTGRLFDTVAALCGFTRQISFEAQAAIWLEHLARTCDDKGEYEFQFDGSELDYRQALLQIIDERAKGVDIAVVSKRFHSGLATALASTAARVSDEHRVDTVVFSGGVMQNMLLSNLLHQRLQAMNLVTLVNHKVPANDGGISLGQAALACFTEQM